MEKKSRTAQERYRDIVSNAVNPPKLCTWCNVTPLGNGKLYCSKYCNYEIVKVRGWCERHNIEFKAPKTKSLMDRYERAVFIAHPWYTGDVNVMDGDEREYMKNRRAEGLTLEEIGIETGHSIEFVRSVLDHEV